MNRHCLSYLSVITLLIFFFQPNKVKSQSVDHFDVNTRIENFGRLWGVIKYFHPAIQKNQINWDTAFVHFYATVTKIDSDIKYNNIIQEMLSLVGPVRELKASRRKIQRDSTITTLDFGWLENNRLLNQNNKEAILSIVTNYRPRKNRTSQLQDIGYNMKGLKRSDENVFPDEAHCMLGYFTYWNRINYFFAYKPIMDIPWDSTLKEFIPQIRKASGTKEYYFLMAKVITRINDGHGWCVNNLVGEEKGMPGFFKLKFIDGKSIVCDIHDSVSVLFGVKRGDEIIESNGKTPLQRKEELKQIISCSIEAERDFTLNNFALGFKYLKENIFKIRESTGAVRTISFFYDLELFNRLNKWLVIDRDSQSYKKLQDEIGYIDAGITSRKQLRKAFREFTDTKAIIIDLRKYGGASGPFYSMRLTNKNLPYATLFAGSQKHPGVFRMITCSYSTNPFGVAFLFRKYYGKVVVLTDENTVSGMELIAMNLQATERVTVIGRNTGGYDGGCHTFLFQPDFAAGYSGDAVFYPDGRPTQRIGVKPDIYVPDDPSILCNTDEILQKALEFLSSHE